jgi:hypothetical protein
MWLFVLMYISRPPILVEPILPSYELEGCKLSVFMLFVRRDWTFYLDAEGSVLILVFSSRA